ncbi:unnamed protein product [Soboliphyme baturini]|uniref:DUF4801 domain-containing protein n=1 Tax=Soboliphyme baturini TaxID=241478 RepID=A0A183IU16_9BILA|nr:unnamed protein product [Soboliphyme baturini]
MRPIELNEALNKIRFKNSSICDCWLLGNTEIICQKKEKTPVTKPCTVVLVDVLKACGHCNACKSVWKCVSNFSYMKRGGRCSSGDALCVFDTSAEESDDEPELLHATEAFDKKSMAPRNADISKHFELRSKKDGVRNGYRLSVSKPQVSLIKNSMTNGYSTSNNIVAGLDSSDESMDDDDIADLINRSTDKKQFSCLRPVASNSQKCVNTLSRIKIRPLEIKLNDIMLCKSAEHSSDASDITNGIYTKSQCLRSRTIAVRNEIDNNQNQSKSKRNRGKNNVTSVTEFKNQRFTCIRAKSDSDNEDKDDKNETKKFKGKNSRLTDIDHIRQRLQASSIPDQLPCREKEFNVVCSFIINGVSSGLSRCVKNFFLMKRSFEKVHTSDSVH